MTAVFNLQVLATAVLRQLAPAQVTCGSRRCQASAHQNFEMKLDTLPEHPTMRDIHDFCVRNNLPSLAQGMIELSPPARLREIAAEVMVSEDVHTYRNRYGEPEYREAICSLLQKQFGVTVAVDNVLGTQGVTSGIFGTLFWLRSKGVTKVGMMQPFYTYHSKGIQAVFGNGNYEIVKTGSDFHLDFDTLGAAFAGGLKALIVTNPGNPSGQVLTEDEIERLVTLAGEHGCHLIFDECYCDMVFGAPFYSPINKGIRDHVTVCRGFSKCLGIQSWRVGYLIGAKSVIEESMVVHDPVYISVPVLQHAVARYLTNDLDDYIAHGARNTAQIQRNWAILAPVFSKVMGWTPIEPKGSMYGCFRHTGKDDMTEVLRALEYGVGICPGSMFYDAGNPNTNLVRIHCGVSEEKAKRIVELLEHPSPRPVKE